MIRLARPSDVPAVQMVEQSAATIFAGTHMDFAADQPPSSAADLLLAIERRLMWVAMADAEIAGFLFAEPCAEGLYLRELSVAAPFQQKGLGRALLTAAIAAARRHGDRLVMLTTDRSLAWNAPFYARFGFAIVEGDAIPVAAQRRLAAQYADGFDPAQRCAMVMQL